MFIDRFDHLRKLLFVIICFLTFFGFLKKFVYRIKFYKIMICTVKLNFRTNKDFYIGGKELWNGIVSLFFEVNNFLRIMLAKDIFVSPQKKHLTLDSNGPITIEADLKPCLLKFLPNRGIHILSRNGLN